MLDKYAARRDSESDDEIDAPGKRYRNKHLPRENYADIFDQEPDIVTTEEKKRHEKEAKKRQLEKEKNEDNGVMLPNMDDSDDENASHKEPETSFSPPQILKQEVSDNLDPEAPNILGYKEEDLSLNPNAGINNGQEIVFNKYDDISTVPDGKSVLSNSVLYPNNGQNPELNPSLKNLLFDKSHANFNVESFGSMKIGDIHPHRRNPPVDPSDVFFEGRNLGGKDKLNECMLKVREFGFVMVVEKSEVSKGRYKLVCERGSRKRKKLIADYDETMWSKCFAYVNIHGWKINTSQMEHSHGPGIIWAESQFMGLLNTPKLAKDKEIFLRENRLFCPEPFQSPTKAIEKENQRDILSHVKGLSKYNTTLLPVVKSEEGVGTSFPHPIMKTEDFSVQLTNTPEYTSPHPKFDQFKETQRENDVKYVQNLCGKVRTLLSGQKSRTISSNCKSNIFVRTEGKYRGTNKTVNLGFTKFFWRRSCEDALKEIWRKRGATYADLS